MCELRRRQEGARSARGYTIHAVTDAEGKPMRPPQWLLDSLNPTDGRTSVRSVE